MISLQYTFNNNKTQTRTNVHTGIDSDSKKSGPAAARCSGAL